MSRTTDTNDREPDNKKRRTATGSHNTESAERQEAASRRNSILIIVLSVVVIVAIVAGVIVSFTSKGSGSSNDTESLVTGETGVDVEENSNDLQLDAYPEINELISNYRQAFKNADTALLQQVYDSDQEINADILTATSAIIEDYLNTQVYTKRGINSGEYVVFVYDELQLADIETLAPNLSVFYVKTNDEGTMYIYRGEYNTATGTYEYEDDVQAYIDEIYEDEDVVELITTVNTKMDSACANDSDLMEFMEKVRSKTSTTTTTTTETKSETDAEETSETDDSETENSDESSDEEA